MIECAITCQNCNNTFKSIIRFKTTSTCMFAAGNEVHVCLPLEMKSHNVSCKPPDKIYFLTKHMLWVLKRTASMTGFF